MANEKEVVVVASKIKALVKNGGCNTAGDAVDGINSLVHWFVDQAVKRAKANGRKTVRAHDFCIE